MNLEIEPLTPDRWDDLVELEVARRKPTRPVMRRSLRGTGRRSG